MPWVWVVWLLPECPRHRTFRLSPPCARGVRAYLRTSLRPVHVRQSPESALIQAAYADRRARRSGTPYRLQIDQGLAILEALHETGWESPAQAWPAVPCNCCRP